MTTTAHPFDDPGGPAAAALRQRWREEYGWHIGQPDPEERDGSLTEAGRAIVAARRKEVGHGH